MAAYVHDPDHRLETGELNMRDFLMHRPEPIDVFAAYKAKSGYVWAKIVSKFH
ncbi:MAG: hypothetical protein V7K48_02060 [Nostoc sp.]|uniref:hypothetical protein n=1 Tax=Nostoc sp. TaxID=1180 RepID=UPI002FF58DDA